MGSAVRVALGLRAGRTKARGEVLKAGMRNFGGVRRTDVDPRTSCEEDAERRSGRCVASFFLMLVPDGIALGIVDETQSLIAPTMINVSLREKSGPREFLTGPIGDVM